MESIQEIAALLRSTEKMATAFVKSVQDKIGQDVPEEIILAAIKRLNPRSLEINKVVAAVKKELSKLPRGSSHGKTRTVIMVDGKAAPLAPKRLPRPSHERQSRIPLRAGMPARKTIVEQLENVLMENWTRAESEGFQPERMDGMEFLRAVHRYCDPRDATRARVLRACQQIDKEDVMISAPVIADVIRQEV